MVPSPVRRVLRPTRILLDIAENRLDEDELEAVGAWLQASAPADPPADLVKRAIIGVSAGAVV